ncbi:hypothetical protein BN1050_02362 [Metalysinibacillus saudimassiliensis]|uniref:Uncharacterized protein n=1 Tax=Metalysinibacillus saudimassiliensis TaxID=1461583 RepID=A0A078MG28_9BACL|nr:hypothetical protein BN1050_02362 [Metalysinibacillus saudimassiliensis]
MMNQLTSYEVTKLLHTEQNDWREATYDDINRVKMEINRIVERSYHDGLDDEVRAYIMLKRTITKQTLRVSEDAIKYYYSFPILKEGALYDTGFMIITKN